MNPQIWMSRKFIFKLLSKIQFGKIKITDKRGTQIFEGKIDADKYSVHLHVTSLSAYKRICINGTIGASEGYMQGEWNVDDLTKLMEIIIKNTEIFDKVQSPMMRVIDYPFRIINKYWKNNITNSKKNILAHYDLGNDFFKLFLDPSMMYSSAIYEPERSSLEHASVNKLETICQQLQLQSTDHVLEIGSGWGGFAIYAAQRFGCKVTTTTISDKQYAYVKKEIEHLGLKDRITLLNQDYRQLSGQYDKLVSIEMIEAIGAKYFDVFFRKCNELIKPNGLLFLQAITMNDQAYHEAKNSIDFIKKYIFPGGCLPSVGVISNCIAEQTEMQLLHMRDIGAHYATTLLDWLKRFNQQIDQVKSLGFSDEFIRMWRFYFCYCAAGFKQAYISDIHGLWRKRA